MDPNDKGVPGATFRQTLRGYDPGEVRRYLEEVEGELTSARVERDRLAERLQELGDKDLASEFDRVSSDLRRILEEAQTAADGIRERAAQDASAWRTQAREEAHESLQAAQADAEALRREAWKTGQELIARAAEEAERTRQAAERDALSILGEAEREAHRTVSAARRESEDTVRVTRMESDRLLVEARGRHDEIIEEARREAETAQERARALEVRRTELLMELEGVRATIQRLESQIDQRSAEPETVPVAPSGARGDQREEPDRPAGERSTEWGTDENVRIVPVPGEVGTTPREPEEVIDATQMADEVRRLREAKPAAPEQPEKEAETTEPFSGSPIAEVEELFATLRVTQEQPPSRSAPKAEASAPPAPDNAPPRALSPLSDPSDVQARLLVPVINQRLRNIKRRMTDTQSLILDELRQDPAWLPNERGLVSELEDDLRLLAGEAHQAGIRGAAEAFGIEASGRAAPPDDPTPAFAEALVGDVLAVLDRAREADQDPAVLAAAVGRVFRSWRTDQSERRVVAIAETAYGEGLRQTLEAAGVDPRLVPSI